MLQLKSQQIDIDSIHPVRFLQQHFPTWTLQRIAEEMEYSDSAVRQWSSGHRGFSRRAQRDAYRVYEKYLT